MQLIIAAVGQKMPGWVEDGYAQYQRRMPRHLSVELREVALPRRGKSPDLKKSLREEASLFLAALPDSTYRVALDENGTQWTTRQLSSKLETWQHNGRAVGFLIGGPDGLDPALLETADQRWSLGLLTLPHPMVRLVLTEQLYRAWTILNNHPYHRE